MSKKGRERHKGSPESDVQWLHIVRKNWTGKRIFEACGIIKREEEKGGRNHGLSRLLLYPAKCTNRKPYYVLSAKLQHDVAGEGVVKEGKNRGGLGFWVYSIPYGILRRKTQFAKEGDSSLQK